MKLRYSLLTATLFCGLYTAPAKATDNFTVLYQQQIAPFWQGVVPQQLKLSDSNTLHYVVITPTVVKATIRSS